MIVQEQSSIQYGSSTINYLVRFTRCKTIAIEVCPDQAVLVTAPEGSEPSVIETVLHKRANWIVKQQQRFSQYTPWDVPQAYVSGESYRYLGRQYRLKVIEGKPIGVKDARSLLFVTVADKHNSKQVQMVLERWYRERAKQIFQERLEVCLPRIQHFEIPTPPLTVRVMKTRWGSCSAAGLVTLNIRLIQTPTDCIDYVLLHELCHLKELNHSKRYYHLLDQVLPDWRERREKLNRFEFS